jgi:signal transduction histidine kinase
MMTAAAQAVSWWRAAGPGRRTYEIGLAVALPAVTAVLSSVLGDLPPLLVAGLAVVDLVLVGLRHRFPATALIVAASLGALAGQVDWVLLLGLSYAAGFRFGGKRLIGTLAAELAGQLALSTVRTGATSIAQLLLTTAVFLFINVFPATLAQLSAQRRRILTLMHERTVHLRQQQEVVAERARVREANRIAREMHDSLGHRLTLISLYAGALRCAPEQSEQTLRLIHTASTGAMDELANILAVLREETNGDESRQRASLADVEDLVDRARSAGAHIELVRTGEAVAVPAMIDQAAYRTVQEGITNALRHARGGTIRAAVRYEDDALVVEVVNGPGEPYHGSTSGQGLYGLAERIRIAGGVLYHGAEPDGGFRLAATLPLTSTAPRADAVPSVPSVPAVPDEFGEDLRRVDQRRRMWTVGVIAGTVVVLGLCAGGVWLGATEQTVSRETYDSLRIGADAHSVQRKLPDRSAQVVPGPDVVAAPPGEDCVTYRAAPTIRSTNPDRGYRFCFRDGALISKEALNDVG